MKPGPKGASKPLTVQQLNKVRTVVKKSPRDAALVAIGTQTAFRASDILALNVGDVRGRDEIRIVEKKTGKVRQTPLNEVVKKTLEVLCEGREDEEPLFVGEKRGTRLTVHTASRLWRKWTEKAGLGHLGGSHCGRKTWARLNFDKGARIEVIAKALNHGNPATTFAYIMITDSELSGLYAPVGEHS